VRRVASEGNGDEEKGGTTVNCAHARRGKLDIRKDSGWSACIGRSANGDHLGAVDLEFCEICGVILIAEALLERLNEDRKDMTR
jgi:hypothetical protein